MHPDPPSGSRLRRCVPPPLILPLLRHCPLQVTFGNLHRKNLSLCISKKDENLNRGNINYHSANHASRSRAEDAENERRLFFPILLLFLISFQFGPDTNSNSTRETLITTVHATPRELVAITATQYEGQEQAGRSHWGHQGGSPRGFREHSEFNLGNLNRGATTKKPLGTGEHKAVLGIKI